MNWFQNHGDKALAFFTASMTLLINMNMVSGAVAKWITFAGALATLAHTVFISPSTATVLPAPTVKP